MALVLVLNAKERLVEIKHSDSPTKKADTIELLSSLPAHLEPTDIPDFLTISQHYASQTPNSYRFLFFNNILQVTIY